MKKLIASFSLYAVLFFTLLFPAQAEQMGGENGTNSSYGTNSIYGTNGMNSYRAYATGMNDNDNTADWGWVGLVGLIGLAGLMGRNRGRDKA